MSAENPADVIEQAAQVLAGLHPGAPGVLNVDIFRARALADAGLLADPADRDEPYAELDNQRSTIERQKSVMAGLRTRAESAEAENAELRATVDRARALADEWESEWDAVAEARAAELRAALDGAGESDE